MGWIRCLGINGSGGACLGSYRSERTPRRMLSTSRNPAVVSSAVRAPLRVSKALVAMVLP